MKGAPFLVATHFKVQHRHPHFDDSDAPCASRRGLSIAPSSRPPLAGPSIACGAAVRGERYTIGYRGSAGYDYIEDVASAFVRAACDTPTGAHVCDFPSLNATPEDFIQQIDHCVPGAAELLIAEGPQLPRHTHRYPCDLRTLFADWEPTSLAEGVRRTVDYEQALL